MGNIIEQGKGYMPGLSGLIRAKNESKFLGACIDSCIDSLDELIVVYNDCTDNTVEVLNKKIQQYPDKLKVYAYNYNVLSHNLTKEEFEYAMSLPEDSRRLHCTQCNYALSLSSYQYAVKIDPDQIYFADELKKWRDICAGLVRKPAYINILFGGSFSLWLSAYRRLSAYFGNPQIWMLPKFFVKKFARSYDAYNHHLLVSGKGAVALSGFNIFVYKQRVYIPFDNVNVHPPYNGEGDTLIFNKKFTSGFHRFYKNEIPYRVTEVFDWSKRIGYAGPVWFHLHANRDYCICRVAEMFNKHPEQFIPIEEFCNYSYKQALAFMSSDVPTLFQRILFAFVHNVGIDRLKKNLYLQHFIKTIFS